ncbi:3-methyl-2-oxobutanoate hydroxymethyltransferase [bacterium]|nr:3-methyl-2-oxobutanoate hydroxymethyltransferase [bacterium]
MKKVTVQTFQQMKNDGEKITALTAYDYSTAKYIDEAGIDFILVGDSLGMVILGYDSTCKVTIDEMKIFTAAVTRGAKRCLVVADLPFMSYHADLAEGVRNAGELIKAGAQAVKLEGATDHILSVIKRCTESGIPVMAHLGFTPQSLNTLGGFKVQSKSYDATLELLEQARKVQEAGAFAVVLEMVPQQSAKYVTENISIPTIGIGAGKDCSGQILVSDDIFGKYSELSPKFVRKYGDLSSLIKNCTQNYINDVKSLNFPSSDESFNLKEEEAEKLCC